MKFYDILFFLDQKQQLIGVEWGTSQAESMYHLLFSSWIHRKLRLTDAFPLKESDRSGEIIWDEDHFLYEKRDAPDQGFYLFLKKRDDREFLFAKSLELISDGVQIYDKNACAVYMNQASRHISQIPDDMAVEGKHLLDLYDLDETVSTIMTCLRTQSPVINRVDHYQSVDGVTITTANTAYPLRRGRELLGSVVFEQNHEIVRSCQKKMEEIGNALKVYEKHPHHTRFSGYTFDNIIGNGKKMREAVELAQKVAPQNTPIMLVGETGTGKEIFAQSIHKAGGHKGGKFVAINCAAIPESLIESLLFGTKKGSFTGSEDKPGYFEEAEGGTLFLDELNSMSLAMQSKILRAIQENTFRRVGSQKDIRMDVRIISSCNEDPFRAISDNQFRKDLFYRLSTVMIELPALREHKEDLEELIRYRLNATSFQFVHSFCEVSPDVLELFREYSWPGNVRELFHVLDYAQNVADSSILCLEHLPSYLLKIKKQALTERETRPEEPVDYHINFKDQTLQDIMDQYEHKILTAALDQYGFNITKTADALGLRRQSLQYRIKKYGIII